MRHALPSSKKKPAKGGLSFHSLRMCATSVLLCVGNEVESDGEFVVNEVVTEVVKERA